MNLRHIHINLGVVVILHKICVCCNLFIQVVEETFPNIIKSPNFCRIDTMYPKHWEIYSIDIQMIIFHRSVKSLFFAHC